MKQDIFDVQLYGDYRRAQHAAIHHLPFELHEFNDTALLDTGKRYITYVLGGDRSVLPPGRLPDKLLKAVAAVISTSIRECLHVTMDNGEVRRIRVRLQELQKP